MLFYGGMSIARMVACGNDNNVHIWDRRVGKLPTMSLPAHTNVGDLNSLQLSRDEQVLKIISVLLIEWAFSYFMKPPFQEPFRSFI
jgi:hypothetical protein